MCELRKKLDDGSTEGFNPKDVPIEALIAAGHKAMPLSKVIREKCLDCCGNEQGEVRKCCSIHCDLWPYRMGSNPFSNRKGNPEALMKARQNRKDQEKC